MGLVKVYIYASLFASIGAFLYGYNIGSVNGVTYMDGFLETFNLNVNNTASGTALSLQENLTTTAVTTYQEENEEISYTPSSPVLDESDVPTGDSEVESSLVLGFMVSMVNIGAFVGSLVGGKNSDFIGRKVVIMVGGTLTVLGGVINCSSFHTLVFIAGRLIAGLGFGLLYAAMPVYIAEIAPRKSRGRLSSSLGPMVALGLLTGYVVNVGCSKFSAGWRLSLGLQCVFGVIYVVGMIFMPKTPRWLLMVHRDEEATKTLQVLCSSDDFKEELQDIKDSLTSNRSSKELTSLMANIRILQRVCIGVVLGIFSPVLGNFITYFSVILFSKLGVLPFVTTFVMGGIILTASFITVIFIDKVGRKTILLIGSLGMALTLAVSAVLILVFRVEEGENRAVGYVVALLICLYVTFYMFSWLTVPYVLNGEIFPLKVRSLAVSISIGAGWLCGFVPNQVTPLLLASPLKTPGTFFIYVGLIIVALLFTLFTLPETKGESLEHIDRLFERPWLECTNLKYYLRCKCFFFKINKSATSSDSVQVTVQTDHFNTTDHDTKHTE